MKVGLFVNTQFPEGFNLGERVREMVEQVCTAREAGFASLWFPHHWLTHPMQCCRSRQSWAMSLHTRRA
jgi:alkanesulfonate monooxygenase SsuD/methylene tetrahydromethanopterin reductase-like flavin-dependent oxidoreductase (luciferase family)